MAGRICGACGGRKTYSLGAYLMGNYTPAHRRGIWGISKLSILFINFYRGMGLFTTAEQKRFLLALMKIADDEKMLEDNEVASEEDDIALALPSAKVDKEEKPVEERPKKRRKLQHVTTSELIDMRVDLRKPTTKGLQPSEWRPLEVPAKDPQEEGEEQGGDTKVKTSSQGSRPPGQPPVYMPLGKEYLEVPVELADTAEDPNWLEEPVTLTIEERSGPETWNNLLLFFEGIQVF
ncbi:hypothetical protein AXG93_3556s1200 [Marchantia polymorpha subsp. ruderalis]|uniref:Uncharacterized protein n=1 Tax=Marchantia polymorpha subsp. ruderalis TaxID=1480154 RepID=A0A176WHQ6_MARPO|nr:hypothetical protein AXG93_3556s1200 [Marchantia polymorpha subsp. ruderalis]